MIYEAHSSFVQQRQNTGADKHCAFMYCILKPDYSENKSIARLMTSSLFRVGGATIYILKVVNFTLPLQQAGIHFVMRGNRMRQEFKAKSFKYILNTPQTVIPQD